MTKPHPGAVSEWFKVQSWKDCVGLYPTGSSNLPRSATLISMRTKSRKAFQRFLGFLVLGKQEKKVRSQILVVQIQGLGRSGSNLP